MYRKVFKNLLLICFTTILLGTVIYCKDSFFESDYYDPPELATHYNGKKFVGSETCMECHQDIYVEHLKTAHHKTSAMPSSETVKGNFSKNGNTLETEEVDISMNTENGTFYQHTASKYEGGNDLISELDVVIGSGTKGQSYLTWEEDRLYQLQASYYTPTDSWINSPNFPARSFKRPVSDACLKCHVTFARNLEVSINGNRYARSQIIYGVDCERCHGPSKQHVVHHRNNPEKVEPAFMVQIKNLPRQQKLDACAVCHSGLRNQQIKGNPFSFMTGDTLESYSRNYYSGRPSAELDVHGNQYGLLTSSKCFKESPTMDCATCHDPHQNQRNDTNYFNAKCITCHSEPAMQCSKKNMHTSLASTNCIACHMPEKTSRSMSVQLGMDQKTKGVNIRTHLIAVYPEKK